jgi:DNA invertase Pin-like site-specific DNA recombinase
MTKPIGIYVRVSQVGGRDVEEEGKTAESQERRACAQLEALGLDAGPVFKDLDVSGKRESRPAFDELLSRIEAGELGGLITKDLSRFGRHKRVEEQILDLEARGAQVIVIDDNLNTATASGRLLLGFMARLNAYYAELTGETWQRVRATAASNGKHVGKTPTGYRRNGGRLEPDPAVAPAVTEAFRCRADGASWTEVARLLTEATGPVMGWDKDQPWSTQAAANLMRSRVYLGEVWERGTCAKRDAHEPLTDEATWQRVQRRRERKERSPRREPGLLSGLVVCSSCEHRMVQDWTRTRQGHRRKHYRCGGYGSCDRRAVVSHGIIEPYVVGHVLDQYLGVFERGEAPDDRTAELEDAVERAKRELQEVEDLRGEIRPAEWARALSAAAEGLDEVERALREYVPAVAVPPKATLIKLKELAAQDDDAARGMLRGLVNRVVEKVEVKPGRLPVEQKVTIHWADGSVTPSPLTLEEVL